jgi:hypothetical protein
MANILLAIWRVTLAVWLIPTHCTSILSERLKLSFEVSMLVRAVLPEIPRIAAV